MARAACGQGSTQTTTWQATLQLGEHAATRNNPSMAAAWQQQAALTWHPAPHLLLAANTAAALLAAAACAAPARLPARCYRQAAALRPAGLGMGSATNITACPTSRLGPCSVANAAHTQQRSRSNKQTAAATPNLSGLHTCCRRRPACSTRQLLLRAHACNNRNASDHQVHGWRHIASTTSRQPSLPSAHSAVQPAIPLARQCLPLQFCRCTHSKQTRSATHLALLPLLVPPLQLPAMQLAPAAAAAAMPHAYMACTAGHTQQRRRDNSFTPHRWAYNCSQSDSSRATSPRCAAAGRSSRLTSPTPHNLAKLPAPQLLLISLGATAPIHSLLTSQQLPHQQGPSPTCTAQHGSVRRFS